MIIGIDLGTTNSLAAYYTEHGPEIIPNRLGERLTPSVVSIDENFGINPAAIRIAAAIPSTLRLITFVVDTIPTFWL